MAETLNHCIPRMQTPAELPHSQNAVTQLGLINLFLDIGKVCLCTTNYHLYHKDPCPERGLNHSKVVIRKHRNNEKKENKQA